ncbi:UNVERIFIED_CONTAM: hypothetical protein Sradi_5374900 [Sesamum radiatum]|uniref:Uncharacterized protein n=1 Tax=Sesamum radiatum TaxID=300843 RepID=A0AAW2LPM7_SESRA
MAGNAVAPSLGDGGRCKRDGAMIDVIALDLWATTSALPDAVAWVGQRRVGGREQGAGGEFF